MSEPVTKSIDLDHDEMVISMQEHDCEIYVITSKRIFRMSNVALVQVPFVREDQAQ